MTDRMIPIKETLTKEETFLALLRNKAQKEQLTRVEKEAKRRSHPTGKMLYHYVLGWANGEEIKSVMRHIACCDLCLKQVMHIRRIENELHEELIQWADCKKRD